MAFCWGDSSQSHKRGCLICGSLWDV